MEYRPVTYVSPSGSRQVVGSAREAFRLKARGWQPEEHVRAEKQVKAAKDRAKERGKPENPGPPDEPGPPETPPNQ